MEKMEQQGGIALNVHGFVLDAQPHMGEVEHDAVKGPVCHTLTALLACAPQPEPLEGEGGRWGAARRM